MKIATIIPLVKNIPQESLTYFTGRDISIGTLVRIPLRNKIIDGIVIDIEDLSASKGSIKESTYKLKKIESVKGKPFFTDAFFEMVQEIKTLYISTTGVVLKTILPSVFLSEYQALKKPIPRTTNPSKIRQEKLVLQASFEERISYYRTYIRESFAQKKSVCLVVPTITDAELFYQELQKGIEAYVFVFHSDLSTKAHVERYNTCITTEHPVLIISTAPYISIPRHDIGTHIIERESSNTYRTVGSTSYDLRICTELYSYYYGSKIILSDNLVRIETFLRHKEKELSAIMPLSYRPNAHLTQTIIQIPTGKKATRTESSHIFTSEILDLLKKSGTKKEKVFLFTLRKGRASVTVCRDCGTNVICDKCNTPLSLFDTNNGANRIFRCVHCGTEKNPNMKCSHCEGWHLVPLGIGTDTVATEITERFPDRPLFRIDKESTKTPTQAKKVMTAFMESENGILVATEMALFYTDKQIDHTVIVSFDSFFSMSSFRVNEKIIQLIIALGARTKQTLSIQTRNPDMPVLRHATTGSLTQFFQQELAERHEFDFPPYMVFIKLTYASTKNTNHAEETLNELLSSYNPTVYKKNILMQKYFLTHALISVPKNHVYPKALSQYAERDSELFTLLEALPPNWTITVDPEDL